MAGSVGDGEFGFQIAPMLDILFVLLLFFMVSAGSQKHEASIVTQLPGTGPGGAQTPSPPFCTWGGKTSCCDT